MKSRSMNMVVGLALLFAVALAGAIFLPSVQEARAQKSESQDNSEPQARKLEGTWRVEVTIRNCQTGVALRTFPSFLTFAKGGTLTETTTGFPPAQRGPGHGFWQHTDGHTYRAASEAFLFNPAGVWAGTQKITQAIEFGADPDEFSSTASIEFSDTNGNVTATGCATAVARRLE